MLTGVRVTMIVVVVTPRSGSAIGVGATTTGPAGVSTGGTTGAGGVTSGPVTTRLPVTTPRLLPVM